MGVGRGTRAVGARHSAWRRGRFGIVAATLFGLTAAGCSSGPQPAALGLRGPTVAFESIDGPPVGIFNRLVDNISASLRGAAAGAAAGRARDIKEPMRVAIRAFSLSRSFFG